MPDFTSLWDKASRLLDTGVDTVVGDRIYYKLPNADWQMLPGFIVFEEPALGMGEIDEPVSNKPRVKIDKALIGEPLRTHRIQHPKLGAGTFMPAGGQPDEQGRYVIFDVQRAST